MSSSGWPNGRQLSICFPPSFVLLTRGVDTLQFPGRRDSSLTVRESNIPLLGFVRSPTLLSIALTRLAIHCRPAELLSTSLSSVPQIPVNLSFTRPLPQPSPILDFAWYPLATVQDPASFCFVASVRDTPVRLVDAGDGRVSASIILY